MNGDECGDLDLIESDANPGQFGPSQTCYDRTVHSCPQVPSLSATIRVTDNAGLDGTVIFLGARGGSSFWAPPSDGTDDTPEHQLQLDLTTGTNDFKVVELAFGGGWNIGAESEWDGQGRLACRPATHVDWLLDRAEFHVADTKVCATGQSGGASALAYMFTHYGLAEHFDGAIFTSGPTYSDLQLACGQTCDISGNPNYPDSTLGCFHASSRWGVDLAYGQPFNPKYETECSEAMGDPEGAEECGELEFDYPCMQHENETDPVFNTRLLKESIALDQVARDYDYVKPGLRFIFGDLDLGSAPAQGEIFHLAVDHNADVLKVELEDLPHQVPANPLGRAEIRSALADFCLVDEP